MSSKTSKKDPYRVACGIRLRDARMAVGLTQESAAEALGRALGMEVPPSRIGNYEQGTRLPDPPVLQAICQIYGAFPSAIYGFDEAPTGADEVKLIEKYRLTDDRGRRAIQGVAESQPALDAGYQVRRAAG